MPWRPLPRFYLKPAAVTTTTVVVGTTLLLGGCTSVRAELLHVCYCSTRYTVVVLVEHHAAGVSYIVYVIMQLRTLQYRRFETARRQ